MRPEIAWNRKSPDRLDPPIIIPAVASFCWSRCGCAWTCEAWRGYSRLVPPDWWRKDKPLKIPRPKSNNASAASDAIGTDELRMEELGGDRSWARARATASSRRSSYGSSDSSATGDKSPMRSAVSQDSWMRIQRCWRAMGFQ